MKLYTAFYHALSTVKITALLVLFIAMLFFSGLANASADNIRFEKIAAKEGLSQQTIEEIFQDSRGYLWFGTQEGLNKYDGNKFTTFMPRLNDAQSISSPWIKSIDEDAQGNIWVGTRNGVSVLNTKTNTFARYLTDGTSSALNDHEVRVVLRDSSDTMWVATRKGLNRFNPQTNTFTQFNFAVIDKPSTDIWALIEDFAGNLWLGTQNKGLIKFDIRTEEYEVIAPSFPIDTLSQASIIRSLFIDSEQVLWIGTFKKGLYRLDLKLPKPKDPVQNIVVQSGFEDLAVNAISEDGMKTVWLGTSSGLYYKKQSDDSFQRLQNTFQGKDVLSDQRITSLRLDRSGVFWVGTSDGLNKWNTRTTQFDHYYKAEDYPYSLSSNIISMIGSHNGFMYVGNQAGLDIVDLSTSQVNNLPIQSDTQEGLKDDRVMSMLTLSDDEIWFGYRLSGATRYNPKQNTYEHYMHDAKLNNSLSAQGVTSIVKDNDGTVWLGTFGGGLSRYNRDTNDFTNYRHDPLDINTLSSNRVMSIFASHDNKIWVGTWDAGLNVFVPSSGTSFRIKNDFDDPDSLGSNTILSILEDSAYNIWIGTQGGGLNLLLESDLDAGRMRFEKYHSANGMPSNVIYGVLEDENNDIWVSSNKALTKIERTTNKIINYTVSHGIQDNEFNSGSYHKDEQGYLYFGGNEGVTRFKASNVKPNPTPPAIELTKFQRLNKFYSLHEVLNPKKNAIEIDHTDYLIAFEFAALDFASPEDNKYKFMLEGFDTDWVESLDVQRATYTNLPSGRYSFKVVASNSDGIWNTEGTSVDLIVNPPPWLSWWAYTVYACLCLFIAYRVRLHYERKEQMLRQNQVELERNVAERTAELSEANEQLLKASITDQLTGLYNRRYLSEIISMKTEDISRRFYKALSNGLVDTVKGPRLMILMFDLDGFKPVNDTYGHDAGDKVIIQVADILKQECRESDIVIRWGGDEYIVIAEINHIDEAEALAERIRAAIANHGFEIGLENKYFLSSSLGFALYPFDYQDPHALSWDQIQILADKALYMSKENGRNTWSGLVQIDEELSRKNLNSIVYNLENAISTNQVNVIRHKKKTNSFA